MLALVFLGFGYSHAFAFDRTSTRPQMGWMRDIGRDRVRIIGLLEILGAVGLIAPAATRILLPWLTPVAATCLAALMGCAIVLHVRRGGEGMFIAANIVLGAIAALVAYGRFVVDTL